MHQSSELLKSVLGKIRNSLIFSQQEILIFPLLLKYIPNNLKFLYFSKFYIVLCSIKMLLTTNYKSNRGKRTIRQVKNLVMKRMEEDVS